MTEYLPEQPVRRRLPSWRRRAARSAPIVQFANVAELESWIVGWLAAKLGMPPASVEREKPLIDYGLDSLVAVSLSGQLEQLLGRPISPSIAWEFPTISEIAAHLMSDRATALADMDMAQSNGRL
jgi:acyl carrier protein